MKKHSERAHATWSASSSAANIACPGRLALVDLIGHLDRESEAAAWGTACHQVAEKCLTPPGREPDEFVGEKVTTKAHEFTFDDEMVDTVRAYVGYVRSAFAAAAPGEDGAMPWLSVEQRFTLAKIDPPFDAGGTADAVVYDPSTETLEVIDLKGGRGVVVEASGNPQARTYALGALLANRGLRVAQVKTTIVQPRAPHKDGRIRSETIGVIDLMEWAADLLAAMRKAASAKAALPADGAGEAWAGDWLRAGDHCRFCPAAGACPALRQRALDAAGVWFDDMDAPRLANQPGELDPAALAGVLDAADMIENWLNACRSLAHTLAETGTPIPGYVLVDKIGRRKWKDDATAIFKLGALDLAADQIYEQKLRSPAQIEKVLGAKRKAEIADLFHTPVTGTNLVREDKTTRPAVRPAVERYFEKID